MSTEAAGGSTGDPAKEPEKDPTQDPGKGTEPSKTSGRTFNQDDVDDIVERRLAAERKRLEPVTAKAAKWDEHETKQKDADTRANDREAAAKEREAQANARLLRAAVTEALVSAGADPDLRDLAAQALIGAEGVQVDQDGEVVGVTEALKRLRKDRPKLFAAEGDPAKPKTPATSGPDHKGTPPPKGKTADDLLKEGDVTGAIGAKLSQAASAGT
jgi:hypothetical protein